MARLPAYCRHSSGQAVVRIAGRSHYLGVHGTPESHEKYRRIVARWVAAGCPRPWVDVTRDATTVQQVVDAYLQHARGYYRRRDGSATGEALVVSAALSFASGLFGTSPLRDFGALSLVACRDAMIARGLARTTINGYVRRIQRMFRWAASMELVRGPEWQSVLAVPGLRAGRSAAVESRRVRSVPIDRVRATQRVLSRMHATMVEVQLLTGMRPGEVCSMRVDEVDTRQTPWTYRPTHHKTAHHGAVREVVLGPRARELVAAFLRVAELSEGRSGRVFPVSAMTYAHVIARACRRARVAPWSPNQLRHTAATRIRAELGLETARAVLGHSSVQTTLVYAERDRAAVERAMERLG